MRKQVVVIAISVLAGLVAVPVFGWVPVTWDQESVSVLVVKGDQREVGLTFTSAWTLGDVYLRVVPEIEPFVSVEPSDVFRVRRGDEVPVSLTISADAAEEFGTLAGALEVRSVWPWWWDLGWLFKKKLTLALDLQPFPLPPDPGEAGKATLDGIDDDSDGVRDDIQRFIAFSYPAVDQAQIRHVLSRYAESLQDRYYATNVQAAVELSNENSFHLSCGEEAIGDLRETVDIRRSIRARMYNTDERIRHYLAYDSLLDGHSPSSATTSSPSQCEK